MSHPSVISPVPPSLLRALPLMLATGCSTTFIMPPKTHLGALPPAAFVDTPQTDVGVAWDGLYSFYSLGTDNAPAGPIGTMGRIEGRHVFAGEDATGDIGGFFGRYAAGIEGGIWLRPGSQRRWAIRIAPGLTLGNYMGQDAATQLRLPGLGMAADAQWAKRFDERLVTSLTFGGGLNFGIPTEEARADTTVVLWPMAYAEVHNRWDFTPPGGRLGGWAALGVQFTWFAPGPVLSGGLKF